MKLKFFNKNEWKLLWPFYLTSLITGLSIFIIPYAIIYFKNLNLSYFEISLFFVMAAAGKFLFEVPTGAVADLYGRRVSSLIGIFLTGVAYCFIPFIDSYYVLLCLYGLIGISSTFISGAMDAWIVDHLMFNGSEELIHDFSVKSSSIAGTGAILSPIIAGVLVNFVAIKW